jgi:hypothetical protein
VTYGFIVIMQELDRLNEILETINAIDFRIQSYDLADDLLIAGSFDFCYYHEIEVIFHEVSYISLPASFGEPHFRRASPVEVIEVGKQMGQQVSNLVAWDTEEVVFCIEATTDYTLNRLPFFVVARSVSWREGRVFYYEREHLKEGERIAPWVLQSSQ